MHILMLVSTSLTEGQLILKCPFGDVGFDQKPTIFFQEFLLYSLKRSGIKKKSIIKWSSINQK